MFELSLGEILQKGYVGWVLQCEQEFVRGGPNWMKSLLSRGDGSSKGRESMKKHDVLEDHLAESSVPS